MLGYLPQNRSRYGKAAPVKFVSVNILQICGEMPGAEAMRVGGVNQLDNIIQNCGKLW